MPDQATHFLCECGCQHTLCGRPITGIILNERPPTCERCVRLHQFEGWTFPLPAVAVTT